MCARVQFLDVTDGKNPVEVMHGDVHRKAHVNPTWHKSTHPYGGAKHPQGCKLA